MDDATVPHILLADLHSRLLRHLARVTGTHFQGLQQAARVLRRDHKFGLELRFGASVKSMWPTISVVILPSVSCDAFWAQIVVATTEGEVDDVQPRAEMVPSLEKQVGAPAENVTPAPDLHAAPEPVIEYVATHSC